MTNSVFAPAKATKAARASGAGISARKVKRGTRFAYTLSEPARVVITIARKAPGRLVGKGSRGPCVKVSGANRSHRHCIRLVRTAGIGGQEQGGRQSTPWDGLVRGKPSKPGRYQAVAVAIDAAGQRSQPRRLGFRIVAAP